VRSVLDVFIRFRILVIAAAVGIIAAGVATLPSMHRDILPESSPVAVDVQTEALGLSAPEVEELVTVPLEKNLFEGIRGVTDMTSDSISGMSDIELHFAPGTNLYQARQLVQERLNSAFVLPNVSSPPTMIQPVSTTSDVMLVGITSKTQSLIDLSVLSRWTIVPKLLGLDGVANISTYGQSDRQLQIQVDPAKMAAVHVTLADVIAAAGNSQLVSPVSYLQGSTPGTGGYIEDGNQRLDIRHILPFGQPGNLAGVPVTNSVTLGDIANVAVGHQALIGDAVVHGTPGLVLVIQKLPSASVPAVASEVKQALAELAPGMPGVSIDTTLFSQSTYANTAFRNVAAYAIIAGILAVVALLLFLLSLRTAFVAVVSIGLSLIVALLVLDQLGYSLNALVLLGLLLALGIVVADATSAGFRPGMGAGLLVALLTMVPLVVSSGTTAGFLRPMVVAFMLAVAASVIVAATAAAATTSLLASVGPQRPPRRVAALHARLSSGYRRSVGTVARLPRMVLPACCAAAGIAALAGVPFLHPGQPTFQDRNLVVQWTAAPGTSLTEMGRLATTATRELQAIPGVQDVGATLGRAVTSNQIVATNSGELWVTMKPNANYRTTLAAVRAVAGDTPGVHGTVSTYEADAMGDVLTTPPGEVVTRIYGTNYASLEQVARQVQARMSGVAGVRNVQVQYPQQAPTLDVEVNLDAAERYGLAAGDIRREAATLLHGLTVGNFFENDEVFDVVVLGDASVRSSVQTVENLLIDDGHGGHVRLGQVASVSVANEPVDIKHDNTSLYIDVTADASGRSVGAAAVGVSSAVASVRLPLAYSTQVLSGTQLDASTHSGAQPGDTVVPGTSFPSFLAYVLAALLGVFLIIQAAVGSWRLALIAFGSLAVSLSGAMLVVYAAGWAGSLGAVAGLAAVFALAARMAITVLARIREGARTAPSALAREDRAGGLASRITGAAVSSSAHVAAAAAVTALALVPFAVSGGPAGLELLFPAACVIVGGLATILLVSLYVLPAAWLRLGPTLAAAAPRFADDEVLVPAPRAPEQPGGPGQPDQHRADKATVWAGEREERYPGHV
jgi:Cu/Ag efflux pump CusA